MGKFSFGLINFVNLSKRFYSTFLTFSIFFQKNAFFNVFFIFGFNVFYICHKVINYLEYYSVSLHIILLLIIHDIRLYGLALSWLPLVDSIACEGVFE